jgi:ATP-binding cassette subfamily F protein uup
MDEPTNDLDIETLELLEELLVDYKGTLLLVSHDRAFLNNVVTSTIVFEGEGEVNEYVGGYDDWLRQRKQVEKVSGKRKDGERELPGKESERARKLSYKEKRELAALPGRIEALEAEQDQLHQTMSDPLFYKTHKDDVVNTKARLSTVDTELAVTYQLWETLEKLQQ